jgi:hypothetical protein
MVLESIHPFESFFRTSTREIGHSKLEHQFGGDQAIFDGDIAPAVNLVLWIDDVTAAVNQTGGNQQK